MQKALTESLFVARFLRTHSLSECASARFYLLRAFLEPCAVAGRETQLPIPKKVRVLSTNSLESIAPLLIARDYTFCHTCGCMNNNCNFSISIDDENNMNNVFIVKFDCYCAIYWEA